MRYLRLRALLVFALLSCLGCLVAISEELVTSNGKVFRNVEVTGLTKEAITVRHEGGLVSIPLSELAPQTRERFSAEQLFRQLQEATAELEKIRREQRLLNLRDRSSVVGAEIKPAPPGETGRTKEVEQRSRTAPLPRLNELPALAATDVIEAFELVDHYKADAGSADQRYSRKTFRVKGVLAQLNEKLFQRSYVVRLESPDRLLDAVCHFSYSDDHKRVIARDSGKHLVATLLNGQESTLGRVGDAVIIEGHCRGLDKNSIVFTGCRFVR